MKGMVHGWLVGLLLVAGCGEEERAVERAPVVERDWQTKEWPVVRGGAALQGRVHDPVSRGPVVEWTYSMGDGIVAGAAIVDRVAVIGDEGGRVVALDLEKRELRWEFAVGDAVTATPAIGGGKVFVGAEDEVFRALDFASGKVIWQIEGGHKFPTGAVLLGERVLVNGYDGVARCLRTGDGGEVWKHEADDFINSAPAVIDGKWVAFGGCDSMIRTVGVEDGKLVGELEMEAQVTTSVGTFGKMVYACTYADQVVAVDVVEGKVGWACEVEELGFGTPPGVDEERVYVGARDKHLHAIGRESGEELWKFPTGAAVESAPLVFDDAVLFGSGDGRLYAVDKVSGKEIWRLDLGEGIVAAAAFAEGRIVVGGEDGSVFVVGGG